ncbi:MULTISPECIES: BREX system ATP-binding protein BrxD [unclassified Halorhodospira]|uniref:BREX system ATP-binding protein BrxD n=1 Tax=unclassified Halorhodospira TaxID=2626748 RepID=UPI001EE95FE2|nr:BREX system ATP-binding protein BrxD [Halorhodospira sp. M39old]MCG5546897.1 BREX system ATP-binding protein BrxD [Halorhodospira sp. M38]
MSDVDSISPERRDEILDALRRGTVPAQSLDLLAVGLQGYEEALDHELTAAEAGRGVFKAVRGEYGSGKTFFARWLQERALSRGFATTEVQISEAETPLHRLETVYRRLVERLSVAGTRYGALRLVVDGWFFTLEEDVLAEYPDLTDESELLDRTTALMERKLEEVNRNAPAFAACLRAYRRALSEGEQGIADGLLAWLGGQPNVAASTKRYAGIKGDIDHFGAMSFLQGLLIVLRDSGHPGLVWVLDEVETLQRVRGDVRDKGLNALRQLMDEIDAGRFPGLYLLMTGTPPFFEGPQGVQRLPPLAQRLHVDFQTEPRFDNPRAPQIRLQNFDHARLLAVGEKVRDLFAAGAPAQERILAKVDDAYLEALATAVTGNLGGNVGIAPRLFLKKLVADILDRVDQFPDFEPREHYALTVTHNELTPQERAAAGTSSVDDIQL